MLCNVHWVDSHLVDAHFCFGSWIPGFILLFFCRWRSNWKAMGEQKATRRSSGLPYSSLSLFLFFYFRFRTLMICVCALSQPMKICKSMMMYVRLCTPCQPICYVYVHMNNMYYMNYNVYITV